MSPKPSKPVAARLGRDRCAELGACPADPAAGAPCLDLRPVIAALACPLALLTGCRPHDFPQYAPNYREYAYVTNGGSGTVSVYDVVNVRLDREIPVGQNPVAVAASPTRNEVYVVNSGTADRPGFRLRHQC